MSECFEVVLTIRIARTRWAADAETAKARVIADLDRAVMSACGENDFVHIEVVRTPR